MSLVHSRSGSSSTTRRSTSRAVRAPGEGDAPLRGRDDAPLLCLPLPAGAEGLRFSPTSLAMGLEPDATGGLALRGPFPPGESRFALSYLLPAEGSALRFERSFPRALPLLSMFIADTGVLTETTRLHRRRPIRTEDRTYLHLEAFEIEPGETVEVDLRQLPAPRPLSALASAGFAAWRRRARSSSWSRRCAGAPREAPPRPAPARLDGRARGRLRQHPRPRRRLRDGQDLGRRPRRDARRAARTGGRLLRDGARGRASRRRGATGCATCGAELPRGALLPGCGASLAEPEGTG